MNLPPQQFNLLLRGDKILECPSCQRLLYHQPIEH
jgi:predicted  nucleic acid-binding Zn-ribbon protein